jgi:hypothetical protein
MLTSKLATPLSGRAKKAAFAVGAAVLVGLVVLAVSGTGGARRSQAVAQPAASVSSQAQTPPPPVVALSPLPTPEISITDLPPTHSAAAAAAPPPPAATAPSRASRSAATPSPASTSQTASPGCQPPYVIDVATGKKRWKLECL